MVCSRFAMMLVDVIYVMLSCEFREGCVRQRYWGYLCCVDGAALLLGGIWLAPMVWFVSCDLIVFCCLYLLGWAVWSQVFVS